MVTNNVGEFDGISGHVGIYAQPLGHCDLFDGEGDCVATIPAGPLCDGVAEWVANAINRHSIGHTRNDPWATKRHSEIATARTALHQDAPAPTTAPGFAVMKEWVFELMDAVLPDRAPDDFITTVALLEKIRGDQRERDAQIVLSKLTETGLDVTDCANGTHDWCYTCIVALLAERAAEIRSAE